MINRFTMKFTTIFLIFIFSSVNAIPEHRNLHGSRPCRYGQNGWRCNGADIVKCNGYSSPTFYHCDIGCSSSSSSSSCICDSDKCNGNGKTNKKCDCLCDFPWTGKSCDKCSIDETYCKYNSTFITDSCYCNCSQTCENGGEQKHDCGCTCKGNWEGDTCETCSLDPNYCNNNGGYLDTSTCECVCPASGSACNNGGTSLIDCSCSCKSPWGGDTCDDCSLTDDHCFGNSTMSSSCTCMCDNIVKCNKMNKKCKCTSCENGWSGDSCATCDLNCDFLHKLDETSCTCVYDEEIITVSFFVFVGIIISLSVLVCCSNCKKHKKQRIKRCEMTEI